MELEAYLEKVKDIQSALIDFIDSTDNLTDQFDALIKIFKNYIPNIREIKLLFQLISKIADDHHRTPNFFDKLDQFINLII